MNPNSAANARAVVDTAISLESNDAHETTPIKALEPR
jgi:hypothetical protein